MSRNTTSQLICLHAALAMVLFMGVALLMVGWVPPPSPAIGALETARMYAENANPIRFSALMMLMGGALYWIFSVAVSNQMKAMEGYAHHPFANVQLACATGTAMAILLASMLWLVAAFRPERSPEVVQLAHDLSWMMFIGLIPPALFQVLSLGLCVLTASAQRQVMPRWFGFFNLWIATGFMAGEFVAFYHHGPFAWNGVASFWIAAVAFFGWVLVTWWVVLEAIGKQASLAQEAV